MDIIIWISVGVFLLLPYYQKVFLMDIRKLNFHMMFWIVLNSFMVLLYYIMYKEIISTAFIILTASTLYYIFSYLFYAKDILNSDLKEKINIITKTRQYNLCKNIIFVLISILLVFDIILIINHRQILESMDRVYLISIVIISYIQIMIYGKELKLKKSL